MYAAAFLVRPPLLLAEGIFVVVDGHPSLDQLTDEFRDKGSLGRLEDGRCLPLGECVGQDQLVHPPDEPSCQFGVGWRRHRLTFHDAFVIFIALESLPARFHATTILGGAFDGRGASGGLL